MLVGAAVETLPEDPVDAVVDDEEGVAYTLVAPEPSPPPAAYVADAGSEYDDHAVDEGSVEAELPKLDVAPDDIGLEVALLYEPEE